MTVRELLDLLKSEDPEAEVHFCTEHSGLGVTAEAEMIYSDITTYGVLLPEELQRHVPCVVLDTGMCGL